MYLVANTFLFLWFIYTSFSYDFFSHLIALNIFLEISDPAYKCKLKEFHEVHEIIKINWISNWIEAYLKLPTLNKQYNISFESSLGDKEVQFINHYACLLYYKTSRNMKFKIDARIHLHSRASQDVIEIFFWQWFLDSILN